ncbi:hypothetical protein BH20ACT19_BH20ACT19_07970 [soil metagenome]
MQAAGASAVALSGCSTGSGGSGDARPNVIVLMCDALRADHVYGDRASTPNMDALRREGLSFTRTYPEAMPTVPARNSMLSGRRQFPWRGWRDYPGLVDSAGWEPLDSVRDTFTSAFKRAGYWTALVTDNPFLAYAQPYEPLRRSFDHFARRGGQVGGQSTGVSERELRRWVPPQMADEASRERVRKYLANVFHPKNGETGQFAERVFRDGVEALGRAARQPPFAMIVDTFEPHEPWTPPRKYVDMYGDPDYRGPEPARPLYRRVSKYLSPSEAAVLVPRMKALYAADITMTDRWLGVFMDRLHDLKLDRETIIVLTGDHGVFVGERDFSGKSSEQLYPELIQVPLVVVDPDRRAAGEATDYFASLHDIGPTILSMAGVKAPRSMDGVDLSPLLSGGRMPDRPYAYGGYKNSFFIRTDRWALSGVNRHGQLKLYDLKNDPGETRNVAEQRPGTARELQAIVKRRAGGALPYYFDPPNKGPGAA